MGSAILVDPAMRFARQQGSQIYFAIFQRNRASLSLLGTVDPQNIFSIRENNFFYFLWDSIRFLIWTRKNKIDAIIDLELFSRCTALLTAFSGAKHRVGFHAFYSEGLYRGEILTKKVAYNQQMHIAKNFMALVKALYINEKNLPSFKEAIADSEIKITKVQIDRAREQKVAHFLETLVAKQSESPLWILFNCHGGDFLPQRRWPAQYFQALGRLILERHPSAYLLLTGSSAERVKIQEIHQMIQHERCFNIAGQIQFEDLPALYSQSHLMVSNDSGPAHFASITDLPTYVFFGPETPSLYGSLGNFHPLYAHLACSPCVSAFNHRKSPCKNNICLQIQKPEMVYEILKSNLVGSAL